MALRLGQTIPLTIEKPAAGGRMIARVDGQIVLVGGAIPGETVQARVDRLGKGVAYAETTAVDAPSADRRDGASDPLCGGCLYAHIAYPRQLAIKAEVIADAFARIARLPLASPVAVLASPEEGYRMRARLHLRGGRLGWFREGTHDICDARLARQLLPETADVLDRVGAALGADAGAAELDLSENAAASERALHLTRAPGAGDRDGGLGALGRLAAAGDLGHVSGLSWSRDGEGGGASVSVVAGDPFVTDALTVEGHTIAWRRHVLAFFQGNRHLLGALVSHVVGQIAPGSAVVDLYAGAGLFSVPAAIARSATVIAVEGDRVAAADLEQNARQADGRVTAVHEPVERFATSRVHESWRGERPGGIDAVVVDPPRTGLSKEALGAAVGLGAPRLVYVSCDVATLARDAARLVDAGYVLGGIQGFDMFPNTPHVEVVATFERAR